MDDTRVGPRLSADCDVLSAADPTVQEFARYLDDLGFRPRFLADGTPCAVQEQGDSPHRAFVASMPKAGTYLLHAVLSEFGVRPTNLHVFPGFVSDYRNYRAGTYRGAYKVYVPMEDSLRLVQPGQFAVGHLHPEHAVRFALSGFRVVFAHRELRKALVSWARYVVATEPDWDVTRAALRHPDGPDRVHTVLTDAVTEDWYLRTARGTSGWLAVPGVVPVRFEDLTGVHGPGAQADVARRVAGALGLRVTPAEARAAVRRGFGTNTITRSESRSTLASHWDDRLEAWFRSVGGPDINRDLGYDTSDTRAREAM